MKLLKFIIPWMVLFAVMACTKEPAQEQSYNITYSESEKYDIDVPETAKAGQTVEFTITVHDESLAITSVLANEEECDMLSSSDNEYKYSFAMPQKDVVLTVNTIVSEYSISCQENAAYTYSGPDTATAGSEVEFSIVVSDQTVGIISVTYGDGQTCELQDKIIGTESTEYKYTFTMPAEDVTLAPQTSVELNRIYRRAGEHTSIAMMNSIRKDEDGNEVPDPEDGGMSICEATKGHIVKFAVTTELGYVQITPDNGGLYIEVTGDVSGAKYQLGWDEDGEYNSGYIFTMPAEPVTITTHTEELTVYEGKPFVGDYEAFRVDVAQIVDETSHQMDMSLMANTRFEIISNNSDANTFDNIGTYVFDEESDFFDYVHETCVDKDGVSRDGYGVRGWWKEEITLINVIDAMAPGLEEPEIYIAPAAGTERFISVPKPSGTSLMVQTTEAGADSYYFVVVDGSPSIEEVTLEWMGEPTDINADGADAIVSGTDGAFMRYTYKDGTVSFTDKGKEAGSYQGPMGELVLDGFGTATLDGTEGTYTIDGGIVSFGGHSFVIDTASMTYTLVDDGSWNGPMSFSGVGNWMVVSGETKKTQIRLEIHDDETASLVIETDYYGRYESQISDRRAYVYDSSENTLTISDVMVGNGSWGYVRTPIVFKVSEDKQSLTLTGSRIYKAYTPNTYIDPSDEMIINAL